MFLLFLAGLTVRDFVGVTLVVLEFSEVLTARLRRLLVHTSTFLISHCAVTAAGRRGRAHQGLQSRELWQYDPELRGHCQRPTRHRRAPRARRRCCHRPCPQAPVQEMGGAPAGGRHSAVCCWFEAALGAPRRIHGDLLNMRVAGKMGQTKLALRAGPEHSDIPEARSTSAAGVETCSDSSKKGFRV